METTLTVGKAACQAGVNLTSSVSIDGVLLAFTFLIVPSVTAILFAERIGTRLEIAWTMGVAASAMGMYFPYRFDAPTGPRSSACSGREDVREPEVPLVDAGASLVAPPLLVELDRDLGARLVGRAKGILDAAVGGVLGERARGPSLGVIALVAEERRQRLPLPALMSVSTSKAASA
jgi:hypothetical protein